MPDVVLWWRLLPVLWRGHWEARRRIGRKALTVVLPAATTWLLLALAISNDGIVSREREQVVVLVAPFLALGFALRAEKRAKASDHRKAGRALGRGAGIDARSGGSPTGNG